MELRRDDLVRAAGDKALVTRNRLRDEALRVRHQLIIQREALGLARQTPVEQCYPVPGRRRAPGLPDGQGRKP